MPITFRNVPRWFSGFAVSVCQVGSATPRVKRTAISTAGAPGPTSAKTVSIPPQFTPLRVPTAVLGRAAESEVIHNSRVAVVVDSTRPTPIPLQPPPKRTKYYTCIDHVMVRCDLHADTTSLLGRATEIGVAQRSHVDLVVVIVVNWLGNLRPVLEKSCKK